MKKSLLIGCFCLLSFSSALSQNFLTGRVYDSVTNENLSGVNIYLPEINNGTSTNENGQFKIASPPLGNKIRVSHIGFSTITIMYQGNNDLQIALLPVQNLDEIIIQSFRATELTPLTEKTLQKDQLRPLLIGQDVEFIIEKTTPSIISYSESGGGFSNYGQFRLRGIDQSRVNITLNGAPLNDMIDQGVFFSNFTDFSNSIQSLQVQRGVGTSSNGTASYAGSINFESAKLNDEKPSGELELVGGSFNTYKARMAAKTGLLPSKTAFFTQFSTFTTDGYRYHAGTDSYSFYGSGGYFADNDVLKFTAFIGKSRNGLAYSPVAISDIDNDPQTNYLNENDTDNFGQQFVQLQHTHRFSNNTNLNSSLYYGGAGGDYFYSYFDENGSLNQINYPLQNNHFGITSNLNTNLGIEKLNFTTGVHAYTFRRLNEESLMPDDANPYYVEHSNKDEFSFFAKADYLLDKFRIYGDLQYRTLNLKINPDDTVLPDEGKIIKNWTFLNPRLGITYELDQHRQLYISFGNSGREPTKVDIFGGYSLTSANLASVKSDDVKPEFVNDLEVGLTISYPKLHGEINGFLMHFTDEIAPIGKYVPEGFLQLRKNIPSSTRAGIEMDLRWEAFDRFSLIGNATYMYSNIAEYRPEESTESYYNVKPALSPEWIGQTTIDYKLTSWWSISLSGRYVSESYQEPTNNELFLMPSFGTADLSTSIKIGKKSSVDLFLNNIFNVRYFTYGAPVDIDWDGNFDEPGYFVQPPRHGYVRFVVGF